MSFEIRLGHHFKRYNSTLRPDTAGWYSTEALWKVAKDVDNPTWHIYAPDVAALLDWNYAFMPDNSKYYWVTAIRSLGNQRWEVSATMDVLATYKDAIMATPGMIEYGFNTDTSGAVYRLQDSRQNVSNVPIEATATVDIMGGKLSTSGTYVLTAVGKNGGVTAYALIDSNLSKLTDSINQDITDAVDPLETTEEILKFFTTNSLAQGSAIQCIRGCTWIPLSEDVFSKTGRRIYLGDFDTQVSGRAMGSNPIYKVETDVAIPWMVSDWRRMNCQMLMYVPYIGTVGIPVDQCNNATSLHFTVSVELLTGGISVRIDAGNYCVYTGSGNMGIPYAIGSSNIPIQNFVQGQMQAIGGGIQFGGGLVGLANPLNTPDAVATMASGLKDITAGVQQSLTPVVQCAGSLGGSAALGQSMTAKLTLLYYQPIDDAGFSAVYGHPVMRVATPVAGYCKTRGFSLQSGARASEMIQISNMMDAGVFIE